MLNSTSQRRNLARLKPEIAAASALLLLFLATPLSLAARDKNKISYGEGLIINIPAPPSEVEQVVQDVVQNGIIRGTKEYNKDEFVAGAIAASDSHVFPVWHEGGKVLYKVREHALDPRNFQDSSDVGTLVVRYVVSPQGDKNTVLRINALFEEENRHVIHKSNGSVESAEYKDIKDRIDAIEVMKQQNLEAEQERQEQKQKPKQKAVVAEEAFPTGSPEAPDPPKANLPVTSTSKLPDTSPADSRPTDSKPTEAAAVANQVPPVETPVTTIPAGQTLEDHVKELRRQLEWNVKAPGAPLKSAPFHTASTLQSLSPGAEVLLLISTPYWYGVETHDGQHGWIMRDQLEQHQ